MNGGGDMDIGVSLSDDEGDDEMDVVDVDGFVE